ncbi:glycosyltransferase [Xanthomarina sp. F1114]|uniref:glycosyltransferase n=1 Tax=Xanthomarina sp. F1114 TaxID=2996019 RepID=UPI00225E39FF|nr:glycosyltransferase [Xanthomarina sp. F1114]MCX7548864.1 glycosyltransferase [Xanthomarina sp. F1114]
MDNKKKVCFLIPSVKSGGIETYVLRFLKYQENELGITVLVRNNSKGELYEAYKATGANILFKPLGYFNIRSIIWYYQFFKKENFDTICDFNANFAGLPIWLSKLVGTRKRIAFYRQSSHHFKKSAFRLAYTNFLNRLVYKYSTDIFSNSLSGLKFFFPYEYSNNAKFKVIKNGVDLRDFSNINVKNKNELREILNLPKDKFIIGHTGRFAHAKNHYFLLDVASKLITEDSDLYFVLIGNDTDKLLPYIVKLGIEDNVRILGYKNNIPEYLYSFDMFFFPSLTEGQPNALIEAMVTGLPIVTSNIPPIIECLPPDRLDCLIDLNDAVSTTSKIIYVKENKQNFIYDNWAIRNFDGRVQLKIFKENL